MELPEDVKQKIREEERQRLAEAQYREQVRQELQGSPASGSQQVPSSARSHRRMPVLVVLGILAVALFVCAIFVFRNHAVTQSGKSTEAAPKKLTTGQIAQSAARSVVVVKTFNEQGEPSGQGSGYLIPGGEVVVTNYHVVRGAGSATVEVLGLEECKCSIFSGTTLSMILRSYNSNAP